MAQVRVHVLAKELNLASADILFHANQLGIEVKTASSGLTEEEVEVIKLELETQSEDEIKNDTDEIDESLEESKDSSSKNGEVAESEDIKIIEIDEKSSPLDISKLINKDATKVVEDLLNLGMNWS